MPTGISNKTGKPNWLGKNHSEKTKIKLSLHHNKNSNPKGALSGSWKGGKFCKDCKIEIGSYKAVRCKPCSGIVRRGENHHNWRGGTTKARVLAFGRLEYRLWRFAVLERDGNECVQCGSKNDLQADHIKPWALYPDLRYAIDNGRALCLDCHKKTDTFGFKLANQINVRSEA